MDYINRIDTDDLKQIEEEIKNFYAGLVSYGYLDVKRAVEVFKEVGKTSDDLAEEVLRFSEDTGTELQNIDVCFVAYDTILQEVRNKIEEVLGFDFLNEGDGTDIYTYGNYMATSYDSTENLKQYLQKKLKNATREQIIELKEDKTTDWFLREIEVY